MGVSDRIVGWWLGALFGVAIGCGDDGGGGAVGDVSTGDEPVASSSGGSQGSGDPGVDSSGGDQTSGGMGQECVPQPEAIAVTPGCMEDQQQSIEFPCGEEVVVLAIAAYEADLAQPDATREQIDAYLNQPGFEGRWSVAERIEELTLGRVRVRFVTELVQLPGTRAEYEAGAWTQWHIDAVRAAVDAGFDPSELSETPAGRRYPLISISVGDFWATPHAGFGLEVDDLQFDGYSLTYYEPGYDVGVITHELGHAFFRWGEYYGQSPNAGLGHWGIMSHGFSSPYNPFLRSCREWSRLYEIGPGVYPVGTRIDIPADGTVVLRHRVADRPGEYFLIEAQQHSPRYPDLPDEGLLVWHVDEAMPWQMGSLDPTMHNRVSIEQADGVYGVETDPMDLGGPGDAFSGDGVDGFGAATRPSSAWWDGTPSGLDVSEISNVGPRMSFVLGPPGSFNGSNVALEPCWNGDVCG